MIVIMRMIIIFSCICLISCQSGPIKVYRPPLQQGNIVTHDMMTKIKPGMSKLQVHYLLGSPLITDDFHNNRWTYVYTLKPGFKKQTEQLYYVYFQNGRVNRVVKSK